MSGIYQVRGESFHRDEDGLILLTEEGVRCGNHERHGHYYHESADAVRACYALTYAPELDTPRILAAMWSCPICGPLDRCRHHV